MLGYCATGRLVMDSAPAIIKMMAMTQAKTGRLIKKFAMAGFSSYFPANGYSSAVSAIVLTSAPGATLCQTSIITLLASPYPPLTRQPSLVVRFELLDGCQRSGLTIGHQGAFCY